MAIDFEKVLRQKHEQIKELSDKKTESMEFANAKNNAVLVWTTLKEHPEINGEEALSDILDLVHFFLRMKTAPGMTTEQVTTEVLKTFPGSTVQPPPPGSTPTPKPEVPPSLFSPPPEKPKDLTPGDITQAQEIGIFTRLKKLGIVEGPAQYKRVSDILGMKEFPLTTFKVLTKKTASSIIDTLQKELDTKK